MLVPTGDISGSWWTQRKQGTSCTTPVLSSVGVTVVLSVPGGLPSLSTSPMTSTNEPAKETKTEKLVPLAHCLLSCDIPLTEDQESKACGCSPFLCWVPNGPPHAHIPSRPQRKSAAWCCGHRRGKQSEVRPGPRAWNWASRNSVPGGVGKTTILQLSHPVGKRPCLLMTWVGPSPYSHHIPVTYLLCSLPFCIAVTSFLSAFLSEDALPYLLECP